MNVGDRYGATDRALYRIAFRTGTAQHALSDAEESISNFVSFGGLAHFGIPVGRTH